MNIILKIARAELRNLFYSPVAWFLAVVFMIQCAVFYSSTVYYFTKMQEFLSKMHDWKGFGSSLTKSIYSYGISSSVMMNLYLFIPLLTMGILSREISNGSIKLLYSSPIKTRHIVFGKYLSLMIFNLILIAIVGIFMVSCVFSVQHVDFGLLLSASLGFYLLICAYAAIGLFMSSLTTYQIVSAIGTFIIIFILSRIGDLWQNIDFVRDLTYFLSMGSRTQSMLGGLITTKDIIYYLVVIFMFMGFTLLKLNSARQSKPWYLTTGKYLTVIILTLMIVYVSSRPRLIGYLDATEAQSNTIHPRVQKIVKGLGDGDVLEVTLYTNLLGLNSNYGMPAARNAYLSAMWEKYVRFKPDIQFKYEYYYDMAADDDRFKAFPGKSLRDIAKDVAKSLDMDLSTFKTPEEMKKIIDLEPENFGLVMKLKYRGKTTFLRTFFDSDPWPTEQNVAAAMARLQNLQMPKILFVTGNLERDIYVEGERGYFGGTINRGFKLSLINNGFDMDTISLITHDIPSNTENIAALVLADPKTALSPEKKEKINRFIESGGNMLILGEPKKEDILNPVLKNLGVQFEKGVLVEVSKQSPPDYVSPYLTQDAANLAESESLLALKNGEEDSIKILMVTAVPITLKDTGAFIIKPLSVTMPHVWLKKGVLVRDSVPPVMNPAEGDFQLDSFVTSVSLTRQIHNKEQRIIVVGDADFLSNRFSNGGEVGTGIYSWLDYNEYPKYGPILPPKDDFLLIGSDTASKLKILYVWILPGLLLLLGTVILIRRKRK